MNRAILPLILVAATFGLGYFAPDVSALARQIFSREEPVEVAEEELVQFSGELIAVDGNRITLRYETAVQAQDGSYLNAGEVVGILRGDVQIQKAQPDPAAPNGIRMDPMTEQELQVGMRMTINGEVTDRGTEVYAISVRY